MTEQATLEAQGLLAFYVNGSLSDDERRAVEDALEQDAELRKELQDMQTVYDNMHSAPLPHRSDTGFARLMRAIDQTPQDVVEPAPAANTARSATPVLKWALVAAFVALAVQSTVLWQANTGVGLASGGVQGDITVAFQPDASEQDIRDLLMTLDLQIVSGPSSLGLYQLKSADPVEDIQMLTANPDVVESAENAMH